MLIYCKLNLKPVFVVNSCKFKLVYFLLLKHKLKSIQSLSSKKGMSITRDKTGLLDWQISPQALFIGFDVRIKLCIKFIK